MVRKIPAHGVRHQRRGSSQTPIAVPAAGTRRSVVAVAVSTLLVVGHEPTMAATASYLADPASDGGALAQVRVGVPTATYSVLESGASWDAWEPQAALLTYVGRPS